MSLCKKYIFSMLCVMFMPVFALANCGSTGLCMGKLVTMHCDSAVCYGTMQNDVLCVTGEYTVAYGLAGDDFICVDTLHASARGGKGNDTIALTYGGGTHYGGPGDDVMVNFGAYLTLLRGGDGNDSLSSTYMADRLYGGNGVDYCHGVHVSPIKHKCELD